MDDHESLRLLSRDLRSANVIQHGRIVREAHEPTTKIAREISSQRDHHIWRVGEVLPVLRHSSADVLAVVFQPQENLRMTSPAPPRRTDMARDMSLFAIDSGEQNSYSLAAPQGAVSP